MCIISEQEEYKNMIDALVVPETLTDEEQKKKYQPLIDYLESNIPDKLFRFRSCTERAFNEFDQNILGFAPACEMNDDFDGMLYLNKDHIKETMIASLTQLKINETIEALNNSTIPEALKDQISKDFIDILSHYDINLMVNQFIDFATKDYNKRMTDISKATQNLKIACLSKCIDSAAMWGYYANNGTGFALSYDLRELNFSEYYLIPIIYSDERFNATEYAEWLLKQQIMQQILINSKFYYLYPSFQHIIPCPDLFMPIKILAHKATCWSHEREWRLIRHKYNELNEKYPQIVKPPTALYLGRNISAINEKILCRIAIEKNIPVYKMMKNNTYSLYSQHIEV